MNKTLKHCVSYRVAGAGVEPISNSQKRKFPVDMLGMVFILNRVSWESVGFFSTCNNEQLPVILK